MSTHRKPFQKTALAIAAVLVVGVGPMEQAMGASCTWNPAVGNWNNPAAWSCGIVPTGPGSDSALIGAGKTVTVNNAQSIFGLSNFGSINIDASLFTLQASGSTTNTGSINVGSGVTAALQVQAGHNINNTGGAINIANGSVVNQFGSAITGGTINSTGSGALVAFGSSASFLSGVTLNGTLDMATNANSRQRIAGGGLTLGGLAGTINIDKAAILSFESDGALGGTGSVVFGSGNGNRLDLDGNGTTLIGAGITIRGHSGSIGNQLNIGGTQVLANNGKISADMAGGTITITESAVTNSNVLEARNGGTLALASNVANSGTGVILADNGVVLQSGSRVTGGTINTANGGVFRATTSSSNFLDAVTLGGTLDMATTANSRERVVNGMTLNGTVNLNNAGILSFEGDGTLGGTGSIAFGGISGNRLDLDGNGTTTIASSVTVRGENGSIGNQLNIGGTQTLVNNGKISADVAGGTITITESVVTNNGTLEAKNGARLVLASNVNGGATGQIVAGAGSEVLQSGVTISGIVNTTGSGNFRPNNSGVNFLTGVTLNGNLDMASVANSRERVSVGGLVLNGTINLNNAGILSFEGDGTLSGAGTIAFGSAAGNRLDLDGNGTTTLGSGTTVRGHTGSIGGQLNIGGTQTLVNNGLVTADVAGGTITFTESALTNHGTVRAAAGTITVGVPVSGTGTLQVDSTGVMNLSNVANSQGRLVMGAAGSVLNIGTQNLTIGNDYTNTGAGTGNSFNRRAGVNGTGLIVAGGNAAQAITGSAVSNGNTANATLTLGNVRVGATTFDIQIANTGSTGPSLRGAIQTSVNGANLTDARLSGAGVTASNYNTGAPGSNTGNLGVTFTAANAGALAPLSGQVLNLRSNFSNIADQKLNIVLSGGAAAYNAAVGNATSPVQIANQRIGGGNSAVLAVANTAAAGSFSEDLNASVGSFSGAAMGSGSILGRLAGTSNTGSGAITVGVNTATAGAKTGNVILDYQTSGAVNGVSNGLGLASAGSQSVTVNGNVYQAAAGAIQSAALNFGTVQVGQTVSRDLIIRNTATGANGFVEDLNATFGASSGVGAGLISGTGSLSGIVAGSDSTGGNGLMTVAVNTFAAGVVNGGIAVNYFTAGAVNGTSNGLGTASAGSETYGVAGTIQMAGNVINQAKPLVNNPVINFGAMRVGAAAPSANVSVTNVASAPPQAALNASISSNGTPVTASGSFNLLAPGATSTNQLVVGMSTSVAGDFTGGNVGSATISFVSDANNVGNCGMNCQITLPSQQVSVSGKVYTPAAALVNTTTVDFGIVHKGDVVAARNVSVSNTAAATALNDTLRGTIGGATGPFNASGTLADLAAQGTNASSFSVGLNTSAAGMFNGTATATFASHDPDLADLDLGSSAIALKGQVNNFAVTALTKSGAGAFSLSNHTYTLDFGNIQLGAGNLTSGLAVLNAAIGPADLLSGNFDLASIGPGFTLSGFGSFAGLIAGDSFGGLSVVFATNVQGAFLSSLVLHSSGSNASGFIGQLDDTTLVLRGNIVAVPEPGTYVLMFAGLLVVVGATRAGQRQRARVSA